MPHIVSFHTLKEWDGFVVAVLDDHLVARLTDLTSPETAENEEVEIPFEELDDDTKSLMIPGRYFRWSIGYERSRSGQKTRTSRMVVRRLPTWSKKDLEQATADAKRISLALKWE